MYYALLTDSDGFVDTFPDEPGARVIWGLILAALVGAYFLTTRSRRRAAEHYEDARRREAEMRANDPDMKKDEY